MSCGLAGRQADMPTDRQTELCGKFSVILLGHTKISKHDWIFHADIALDVGPSQMAVVKRAHAADNR